MSQYLKLHLFSRTMNSQCKKPDITKTDNAIMELTQIIIFLLES